MNPIDVDVSKVKGQGHSRRVLPPTCGVSNNVMFPHCDDGRWVLEEALLNFIFSSIFFQEKLELLRSLG